MLGQNCIAEDPTLCTNIRSHVYDSDEVSAYPTAVSIANVSKGTTKREIAKIEGIEEHIFRKQNMNMILGQSNSIEYCNTMFGFASSVELLNMFKKNNSNSMIESF